MYKIFSTEPSICTIATASPLQCEQDYENDGFHTHDYVVLYGTRDYGDVINVPNQLIL